jgi:hypothetical protein
MMGGNAADLFLRRKWTFKAYGRQVVFIKRPIESNEHVLMKALLWALYLPTYPSLSVEVSIGDRYKPDLIACRDDGAPLFWGESGKVGREKIRSLARRYRSVHFAMAKWNSNLEPFIELVRDALNAVQRAAPFDVLRFPADSVERFIDVNGHVQVSHNDLEWQRLW